MKNALHFTFNNLLYLHCSGAWRNINAFINVVMFRTKIDQNMNKPLTIACFLFCSEADQSDSSGPVYSDSLFVEIC